MRNHFRTGIMEYDIPQTPNYEYLGIPITVINRAQYLKKYQTIISKIVNDPSMEDSDKTNLVRSHFVQKLHYHTSGSDEDSKVRLSC